VFCWATQNITGLFSDTVDQASGTTVCGVRLLLERGLRIRTHVPAHYNTISLGNLENRNPNVRAGLLYILNGKTSNI